MKNPVVLASGKEAVNLFKTLYKPPTMVRKLHSTLGWVSLHAGTVVSDNRLVVNVNDEEICFMKGEKLYRMNTADFIYDDLITRIASKLTRVSTFVSGTQKTIDLIIGLVLPLYLDLGFSVVKTVTICYAHQRELEQAYDCINRIMMNMDYMRCKHPFFHEKLRQRFGDVILFDGIIGVSPTKIALFLACCLVMMKFDKLHQVKFINKIFMELSLLHIKGVTAAAAEKNLKQFLEAFERIMSVCSTKEERNMIILEIAKNPESCIRYGQIADDLKKLLVIIEIFKKQF